MIKFENNCYICPRPCAGCGRDRQETRICDDCCDNYAEYRLDGDDLCEDCLRKRLKKDVKGLLDRIDTMSYLSIRETAEIFDYDLEVL